MRWLLDNSQSAQTVSTVVSQAGGKIVGRTRLQKMFYLLAVAGYLDDFSFEYRHYGPFSEELARATTMACLAGSLDEEEHPASWGGTYSVFVSKRSGRESTDEAKSLLLQAANKANPIDLELAATAIYLFKAGEGDPWEETRRRKPEKAKRIETAKLLVQELKQIPVPNAFPSI